MYLLKRGSTKAPAIRPIDWAGETEGVAQPRGRTLLLDFFSYGDPAGVRALPRLRELAEHYRTAGLSVVGVHVPAYDFERPLDVARREIWRLGIPYPVALDHGFEVFRAYGLRDLPARVLVDGAGFVRGWEEAGGDLDLIERALRTLLGETETGRLPEPLSTGVNGPRGLRWRPTREVRFGTRGAGFGPPDAREGRDGDAREFAELPELRAEGVAYLEGSWQLGKDRVTTQGENCGLAVVFEGASAAAVLSTPELLGDEPAEALLTLDGRPPDAQAKGGDVELTEAGAAIAIDRGGVYELMSAREFGIHNLDLRIRGSGVAVHLLHFGTLDVSELA